MVKKSYSEKLKDPKWKEKRLEILKRERFKCEGCGKSGTVLDVHHQYYCSNREPWEYPNWNFVALCRPCHEEWGKRPGFFEIIFECFENTPEPVLLCFARAVRKKKGMESLSAWCSALEAVLNEKETKL